MKMDGHWYLVDELIELLAPSHQAAWKQRATRALVAHCVELRQPLYRTIKTPEGEKRAGGRPQRPILIDETGARQLMAEAGVQWELAQLRPYAVPYRMSWQARQFMTLDGAPSFFDANLLKLAHPELKLPAQDLLAPVPSSRFHQLLLDNNLFQYLEPDLQYVE